MLDVLLALRPGCMAGDLPGTGDAYLALQGRRHGMEDLSLGLDAAFVA